MRPTRPKSDIKRVSMVTDEVIRERRASLHPEHKKVWVGSGKPGGQTMGALRCQLDTAAVTIEEQKSQIDELTLQVGSLSNDLASTKMQLRQAEEVIIEHEARSPVPENKMDDVLLADALQQVEEKMKNKAHALEHALHEIEELHDVLSQIQALHATTKAENSSLKAELAQQNKISAEQAEELELTQSQLMEMSSKFDERKDTQNATETGLRQAVAQLSATVQAQEAEIAAIDRRSQEVVANKETEVKRTEAAKCEAKVAEAEQELGKEIAILKDELVAAEAENMAVREDLDKKGMDLEKYRSNFNETVAELQEALADAKSAQEKAVSSSQAQERQFKDEITRLVEEHARTVDELQRAHAQAIVELETELCHDFAEKKGVMDRMIVNLRDKVDAGEIQREKHRAITHDLASRLESAEIEISELEAMNTRLGDEAFKRRQFRLNKKGTSTVQPAFKPPSYRTEGIKPPPKIVPKNTKVKPTANLTFTAAPESFAVYIDKDKRDTTKRKTARRPMFEPRTPPKIHAPGQKRRFSHVKSKTDSSSAYEAVAAGNARAMDALGECLDAIAPEVYDNVVELAPNDAITNGNVDESVTTVDAPMLEVASASASGADDDAAATGAECDAIPRIHKSVSVCSTSFVLRDMP